MPSTGCVVADSGPLIALAILGRLDLPQRLWGRAVIPATVLEECTRLDGKEGARLIREAVSSGHLEVMGDPEELAEIGSSRLDPGERQAMTLALELQAILLIDESRGRKLAGKLGIPHTGICGLLVLAKRRGLLESIAGMLSQLQRGGYFLAPDLLRDTLHLAGER